MKIRLNWGTSIVIAIVLFMAFILSFVYKTIFIDKYEHHLVSEDYYKEELHYQDEIDKINNANLLIKNVSISNSKKGILIKFPENLNYENISGTISFLRRSNHQLDFEIKIELTSHSIIIEDKLLVAGKWEIKIDWKNNDEEYLLKESWFY